MKAGAFPPERSSLSGIVSSREDFFRFQKLVMSSPKYTQVVKSKWKEAFGELMKNIKNKNSDNTKMMKRMSTSNLKFL